MMKTSNPVIGPLGHNLRYGAGPGPAGAEDPLGRFLEADLWDRPAPFPRAPAGNRLGGTACAGTHKPGHNQ